MVKEYLAAICLTLMIVEYAEPIQLIKKFFYMGPEDSPKTIVSKIGKELFNCALCTGTWIGALITWDWQHALIIAFAAEISDRIFAQVVYFIKK